MWVTGVQTCALPIYQTCWPSPRQINLLSSMQTGERLCGIVETILHQLARQAGGVCVMQIGSASPPNEVDRELSVASEVPNSLNHSTHSYDLRDETFGDPSEDDTRPCFERRRDPDSWRETRVNGDKESLGEDYYHLPRRTCGPCVRGSTPRHIDRKSTR